MPRNPQIFPDKFILDGTVSDSGIGALEVAVNSLSIASKSGAMRQANAIRVGGLGSIKNQNRGMPTLNSLLPTRSVGRFTVAPSEPAGTVGYFIGGWGDTGDSTRINLQFSRMDRFTFATDSIVNLGSQTYIHAQFVFGTTSFGYYCWAPNTQKFFARFTFQTESISPIGSVLFPSRYQGASLKSQSKGYACAGVPTSGATPCGNIDRFTFAGEVCVSIATVLIAKTSPFGFGNKFNGYVGGGGSASESSIFNNTERFSYASEVSALISAVLTTPRTQLTTWMPGTASASFLLSGSCLGSFPTPPGSPVRTYRTNTIEKFTFAGETCTVIGATFAKGNCFYGAIGNSTRSVIGGGLTHIDAFTVQGSYILDSNEIKAFTYATETQQVLGCTLSIGRHATAGLDNSGI